MNATRRWKRTRKAEKLFRHSLSHKLYQFVIAREIFSSFFSLPFLVSFFVAALSPRWETLPVSLVNAIVSKLMVRRSMTTLSNLYQLIHIVGGSNSDIALHRNCTGLKARWASTHWKAVGIHERKYHLESTSALSLSHFRSLDSVLKPHDHCCRYLLPPLGRCIPDSGIVQRARDYHWKKKFWRKSKRQRQTKDFF